MARDALAAEALLAKESAKMRDDARHAIHAEVGAWDEDRCREYLTRHDVSFELTNSLETLRELARNHHMKHPVEVVKTVVFERPDLPLV